MNTETEFLDSYKKIKTSYKNVMAQIDIAIDHEEHERLQEAINAYECCIQSIEEIFSIPVGIPEDIDPVETQWNDACAIIQKLKGAKTEMIYRQRVLRNKISPIDVNAVEAALEEKDVTDENDVAEPAAKKKSVLLDNPPTHFDINTASGERKTYRDIINGLREVIATENSGVQFDTLFQCQIKLYKIEPDGVVTSVAGNIPMSLVMCTIGGKWKYLNNIFFIQCPLNTTDTASSTNNNMIWLYPLIPTVTNCYRTDYGAFIFPDLELNIPGSAFGIIIIEETVTVDSDEELSDLQQFFLDLLEAILAGTVEKLQQPSSSRVPRDTSQQVSMQIVNAANFVAKYLIKGAEKTGDIMEKTTPFIISKMNPAPPDTPPVSSTVQTSVEVAKNVTSVAATATSWVAGKVGSASLALGRYLAPHVQTQGKKLLQKGFGCDSAEANNKMEGALVIAAGAVEGFSTIFNGLEESARILGGNISNNSVKIIEHKYGQSAGNVAAGTFDTIGNAFNVSRNVNYVTPNGIVKKMAKNTGAAVVIDLGKNVQQESQYVPAGSLYPDLRSIKEK
ncbi:protein spartin [Teleopsis dalmanni]|uniref:protein spartin n=1 Tax=Teleopsis dalmanni TaxID=139649 RepID=UPI000D32AA75|nr:protein spartin [Teleopsis dalmanni]XP_037949807.1 protein spartin [Teleopsis dalmanni]XP_037949808.1 protein spartin [Teleopsis dalmanni]